jgi:phosphoglycerate dehydrogenase-like enzyme
MADIPELIGSPVTVTNTRGAHAQTIAEHAFGMLIYLARQFPAIVAAQKASAWARAIEPAPVGLSGMTLGIVGLGNIGRAIAKRGWAFDMDVIAVDINDVPKPEYVSQVHRLDWLPELLKQSDVVAVSAPFTHQTEGLLSAERLALMKPSAYLLVLSRGGIIDEAALVKMLREGRLAGAGLDVTAQEPLPASSELWSAPNLFLSPHCSGRSKQTTALASRIFHDNLARYLAGQPLTNLVDMKAGF